MAKKKVAIVLSGGVSLGAYIAGALDEIMAAFASSEDYEIDIITGASAGATTAAIIAHSLLYRNGKTALENVWVKEIDIVDMLDAQIPSDQPISALSARHLREVAQKTIEWGESGNGQRAHFCAENLTVAMTLANTTALPYVSSVKQSTGSEEEAFVQYRHSEQETFLLSQDFAPTDPIWNRIAEVARASAAIPFVFPLVPLERRTHSGDTTPHDIHYVHQPTFQGEARFWYYDGGTYNNLPVDLAWHYAQQDPDSLEDRIIVVINPWRREVQDINVAPLEPNLLQQAMGLLTALRTESSAIQLQKEVATRSTVEQGRDADPLRLLPGVDAAPVEVLSNFALVMPGKEETRPLLGTYLQAMGAFLDEQFRQYDFRRGAADARRVALNRLNIPEYDSGRGADFYKPNEDPNLNFDLSTYSKLGEVTSTRDSSRTVKDVFETAVRGRVEAIVRRWDAPGWDFVLDPLLANFVADYAVNSLPGMWAPEERK
jgi:predicted acylesterase/phospholipase RssA